MLKTKESFTWERAYSSLGSVEVDAGAPVEWNEKNQCYYVKPEHFGNGIVQHDAVHYGCRVDRFNVTGGSIEELTEIWRRLDVPGCDTLVEKGYKYVIQFEEDGKNFGAPMTFKEDIDITHFIVEGTRIKLVYNKKWIDSLSDAELRFVITHEIYHAGRRFDSAAGYANI